MQKARCTLDGIVWDADDFARLSRIEIELKRKNLICENCGEFAWFRTSNRITLLPHFCAHHSENCSLKVQYVVEPSDLPSQSEHEANAGNDIVIPLFEEQGGGIDTTPAINPVPGGIPRQEGGRVVHVPGRAIDLARQASLRLMLYRLVQSVSYRNSNSRLALYRTPDEVFIQGAVREIVVNFNDINRTHHDRRLIYWGAIASAGRTEDGKIWLNASDDYSGVSAVIYPDIADAFLTKFELFDLEDLAGAHVLVVGTCHFAASNKPIIWCGSPRYITIRRYRI